MTELEARRASASSSDAEEIVVGRFPDCTIRVSHHEAFLKVAIVGSGSELLRVSWIPLVDDDNYDCAADLKIS